MPAPGIEYNIESYADVSPIHVIQESMDITGTTAKEAEKTITGSLGAMKSSVKNFIVGLGRTDADIEDLCENIIEAFRNVLSNVTPIIQNIVGVIPPALDAIIVEVGDLPRLRPAHHSLRRFSQRYCAFTKAFPWR